MMLTTPCSTAVEDVIPHNTSQGGKRTEMDSRAAFQIRYARHGPMPGKIWDSRLAMAPQGVLDPVVHCILVSPTMGKISLYQACNSCVPSESARKRLTLSIGFNKSNYDQVDVVSEWEYTDDTNRSTIVEYRKFILFLCPINSNCRCLLSSILGISGTIIDDQLGALVNCLPRKHHQRQLPQARVHFL
jgi:hypothetical protein